MSQPAIKIDDVIEQTYPGVNQIGKGGVGTVFKGKNVLMKEACNKDSRFKEG